MAADESGKPRRLFAPELPSLGGEVVLPEESVRHVHVLRLRQGEGVRLFDARGNEADATLVRVTRQEITCAAQPVEAAPPRSARVTLILGVPKAPRLEGIVRMTTELGVHAVRFAQTERVVPRFASELPKLERLARVAREACAQSGQARAPELSGPLPLLQVAALAPADAHKLVFWEEARAQDMLRALPGGGSQEVWAVVGPEGGLSADEVRELQSLGYRAAWLGEGILRVDTAAVVIAALLLDRLRTSALPDQF